MNAMMIIQLSIGCMTYYMYVYVR